MLRFLFLPLLLFCFPAFSQNAYYLSMDSLPKEYPQWLFRDGDQIQWADTAFDDSQWQPYATAIHANLKASPFKGIGWFRLHLNLDSNITGQPLAVVIHQYGASELYVDGQLFHQFGSINGDHMLARDPEGIPVVLVFHKPGPHLLAMRYANYNYLHDNRRFGETEAGFSLSLEQADNAIFSSIDEVIPVLIVMMSLFGVFAALFCSHLILYLFYRAEKSNFLFSIFSGFLAALFLVPALLSVSDNPVTQIHGGFAMLFIVIGASLSLSALINGLFNRRKWFFWLMTTLAAVIIVWLFVDPLIAPLLVAGFCALAVLESIAATIAAMIRRVPGARIIGIGILFFMLLLVTIVLLAIINDGLTVETGSTAGLVLKVTIGAAILSIPLSMSAYLAWKFAAVNKGLKAHLVQVQLLSEKTITQELEKQHILEHQKEDLEREVIVRTAEVREQHHKIEMQHEALKAEKKKSDDLLLNILPAGVAEELKERGRSEARLYEEVSVLFTDFVDFTQQSETMSPAALVAEIDHCFRGFDDIIEKHHLEKIKTVGDAYIAVAGLPVAKENHAKAVVAAAIEIRDFMLARNQSAGSFGIRLGVHSGPVVAGIVGIKKFAYDIWGDTVNTAARMEQHSEDGKVNISETTYRLVRNDFRCVYRGEIEAKHKGKMEMYFAENR